MNPTLAGMKPSKFYIREYIRQYLEKHGSGKTRCLDLGCGRAELLFPLVRGYPNFSYVGLEPHRADREKAEALYQGLPNASFVPSFAYARMANSETLGGFDFVISLSVLEHVKNLPAFLKFSVERTRSGGSIIHLYDLGHALYPKSLKEKIQVALCNNTFTRMFIL